MKKKQRITDQGLGETVKVKQQYKITKKKDNWVQNVYLVFFVLLVFVISIIAYHKYINQFITNNCKP